MSKRVRILLIALIGIVVVLTATTFAYYYFERNFGGNVDIGKITSANVTYYYKDASGNDVIFEAGNKGFDETHNTLTCYASKAGKDDNEGYMHLCDIYAKVHIETEISVRIRVKIEDTWIDNKIFYSDRERVTTYKERPLPLSILNTDNVETEPFLYASDDWFVSGDYVYYNLIIKPQSGGVDIDFLANGNSELDYYYNYDSASVTYRAIMFTEFKLQVEVIQANRAQAVWGVKYN